MDGGIGEEYASSNISTVRNTRVYQEIYSPGVYGSPCYGTALVIVEKCDTTGNSKMCMWHRIRRYAMCMHSAEAPSM